MTENDSAPTGAPPKLDAFIVCDHVHKDPATGKHTLIGVWDTVDAEEFPAGYPEFGLYFKLTGLHGSYAFGVQCLAPDLQEVVAELHPPEEPILANDPLETYELAFNLPGIGFPEEGRYTLRLLYNGIIGPEITITATKRADA